MKAALEESGVVDSLERVDWNFPRAATPAGTVHSLHWFPGNFIPQIPSFLIQLLSKKGDLVCDPFCGSGTTGIEAIRLGRCCRQSDINRASIHVASGKLAAFSGEGVRQALSEVLDELMLELGAERKWALGADGCGDAVELKCWFHPATYGQLGWLWKLIERFSGDSRAVLEMIFTDTLFGCASVSGAKTRTGKRRRHHWGWVADNVKPRDLVPHNAIERFRSRLFHAVRLLGAERGEVVGEASVVREDAGALSAATDSVDLIVTSPPYLGMIDYAAANRLTYLWMHWPLEQDMKLEIGARRHRTRPSALGAYLESMQSACGEMARVLRPGGYCAIVIGASRKYPEAVNGVISLMADLLEKVWGPEPRIPTRRRVSERQGTMPTEYICIFRK